MSAADELRQAIAERDRIAAQLLQADERVKAALPAFGKERGYVFRPTLESARRELGL